MRFNGGKESGCRQVGGLNRFIRRTSVACRRRNPVALDQDIFLSGQIFVSNVDFPEVGQVVGTKIPVRVNTPPGFAERCGQSGEIEPK